MKTTKAEFDRYVAHCKYWMKELSLGNYSYAFVMEDSDHDANVCVNDERCVLVVLSENRQGLYSIPCVARHEMLEVLLDDLSRGLYPVFSDELIQGKLHDVIQRLEKILPVPSDREVGYMGKKSKKSKPLEGKKVDGKVAGKKKGNK